MLEKHRLFASHMPPNWRPGPQPRYVPWLGIKLAITWFAGQCSIHWAIPARVRMSFLISCIMYMYFTLKIEDLFFFPYIHLFLSCLPPYHLATPRVICCYYKWFLSLKSWVHVSKCSFESKKDYISFTLKYQYIW